MVVPVREEVFAAARKLRLMAIPINQSASDVKYVAFYRNAPTSAVTHFAPVLKIDKNVRYKELFPSGSDMVRRGEIPLKVYHLGPMEVLEKPVKKGWSAPIAGPRYTSLEALRKGRYIDEVWPPETEEAKKKLRQRQRNHDERKKRDQQVTADAKAKEAKQAEAPSKPSQKEGEKATPSKRKRRRRRSKKETEEASKAEKAAAATVEAEARRQTKGKLPAVHYIVDGANVAMEARKYKEGGRLRQLELVVDRLKAVKGAVVTVIVDAGLRHHIDRQKDLERMIERREVLQAPAQTQADEFILMTGEYLRSKGEKVAIVSNDIYSDYIKKYKPRFDWVHGVQEQFMFIFSPDKNEVLDVMISMA